MERDIEKEKEILRNCGALGYTIDRTKKVFDFEFHDDKKIIEEMQIGRTRSDYVIDLKLFEMAQSGDMKAMEKLEILRKQRAKI